MIREILGKIRAMVSRWRGNVELDSAVLAYRKMGHPTPFVAALHERTLRGYLEDFRREASAKFAADPDTNIYSLKLDFIDRYAVKAQVLGDREAIAFKNTIEAMPLNEALYPDIYDSCHRYWLLKARDAQESSRDRPWWLRILR